MLRGIIAESNGTTFAGQPAIFLDRDGVVNERIVGGYVVTLEQLHIIQPFVAAFRAISRAWPGPIVLVSNQACIAKGLLDEAGLRAIMRRTVDLLHTDGIDIAAWYCCPHGPDDGCSCRKPQPGLFTECAAQLGVSLHRSCFIGDTESDARAGEAAGCATFIVDAAVPPTFRSARAFVDRALVH